MYNQNKDSNKFKKQKTTKTARKIELYGSPTTKELKKKHSSRLVGGVETAARVEKICSKAVTGGPGRKGGS